MNTNYILDNAYLLIISLAIVVVQFYIFSSTCKKIRLINGILANREYFRILKLYSSDDEESVNGIIITEDEHGIKYNNPVTEEIEQSITTYLRKNKGAVSDFSLIKDIVERNCDTEVAEVEAQTSMPLYIGLIGTVAGIVLGLSSLALRGENLGDPSCIMSLMVGVAFAMIASGMGVVFTSLSIWKNKKCGVVLEGNKNKFYTWIQTELLPVLSSSTVSTLSLLERNLTNFNNSFAKIVKQLDEKLTDVGDLYGSQIELLDRIEKIDIHKMATANVKILETLTRSADKLENFAQYMDRTTEYLSAVKELNEKIDEHLERTEALAVISDFYKKQMDEIQLRQNAIKTVAIKVDDTMKKTFADLENNTKEGLQGLQAVYTKQTEMMEELANRQGNTLDDTIKKLNAMIILSKELQQMPKTVRELSSNAMLQSKATEDLAKAVAKLQVRNSGGYGGRRSLFGWLSSTWRKLMSFLKKRKDGKINKNRSYEEGFNSAFRKKDKSQIPFNPRNINRVK